MAVTALNTEEMFDFFTQMGMVLESGLSIAEGLEIIEQDSMEVHLKEVCRQLRPHVEQEGSFHTALLAVPVVDHYAMHMIEIGEVSGTLDNVMRELALYYERNADLKQSLKEAMSYPSILLVMMWAVVGIIVWKVLPIFEKVLLNMGSVLSASAQTMMDFGRIFAWVSFLVLSALLVVLLIVYIVMKRKGTLRFLSRFFLTKKLYHNMSMAKMSYALSLFVSAGYGMEEALGYVIDVVEDSRLIHKLKACKEGLKQEEAFAYVLQKEKLYQGIYANLIITGFQSGKSEEVMKKVSDLYEKAVDDSISAFLNMIEPAIVIFLSLIVGIILLSVMLPLMSIMSSIG